MSRTRAKVERFAVSADSISVRDDETVTTKLGVKTYVQCRSILTKITGSAFISSDATLASEVAKNFDCKHIRIEPASTATIWVPLEKAGQFEILLREAYELRVASRVKRSQSAVAKTAAAVDEALSNLNSSAGPSNVVTLPVIRPREEPEEEAPTSGTPEQPDRLKLLIQSMDNLRKSVEALTTATAKTNEKIDRLLDRTTTAEIDQVISEIPASTSAGVHRR